MGHGPAVKLGKDNASDYKARLGIWMFIFYTITYGGFIAVNTVKPTLMEARIAGLNLAVVYGMALIFLAFLLAIVYNHLCTAAEKRLNR